MFLLVSVVIPASKGQVNATDEGKHLINHNKLLMMCPVEHSTSHMIRMPQYLVRRNQRKTSDKCED